MSRISQLDFVEDWASVARRADYRSRRMAELLGVSDSQLRRYFQQKSKKSPQGWMNEIRLWEAARMLAAKTSVKEVAFTLKFKSAAHFSRHFKQYHGRTPTQCLEMVCESGGQGRSLMVVTATMEASETVARP